jgi:DNA-binding NarL/FixJ family response regulator
LLQIYAACTLAEIMAALAAGSKLLGSSAEALWLGALLDQHAEQRLATVGSSAKENAELANLTRREKEVLHRISLGETDAGIGSALGISPKTASKHVENILRKLGVETRTAAALLGVPRLG